MLAFWKVRAYTLKGDIHLLMMNLMRRTLELYGEICDKFIDRGKLQSKTYKINISAKGVNIPSMVHIYLITNKYSSGIVNA